MRKIRLIAKATRERCGRAGQLESAASEWLSKNDERKKNTMSPHWPEYLNAGMPGRKPIY